MIEASGLLPPPIPPIKEDRTAKAAGMPAKAKGAINSPGKRGRANRKIASAWVQMENMFEKELSCRSIMKLTTGPARMGGIKD